MLVVCGVFRFVVAWYVVCCCGLVRACRGVCLCGCVCGLVCVALCRFSLCVVVLRAGVAHGACMLVCVCLCVCVFVYEGVVMLCFVGLFVWL